MLKRLDYLAESVLEYDDNEAFNIYLDERYQTEHAKVRYSKALFEQEPETYEILLGDYNLEQDLETE
jgi:hypothetical protein